MPARTSLEARIDALSRYWDVRKPDGDGPFPLVVQMPGCGGKKPFQDTWAEIAQKTGVAGALALVLQILTQASDYIALLTGLPPKLLQIILVVATSGIIIGGVVFAVIALREVVIRKLRGEDVA